MNCCREDVITAQFVNVKRHFIPHLEMAHDSCWVSIVTISNNLKVILNRNDDFNVATYWSKCLDPNWWGVEVQAFGENQILVTTCSHWGYNCSSRSILTFVLMLLFFFCQWYFWTVFTSFMRWYIYDEIEHNTTVFCPRIVNSICTSSDEKDTVEKWTSVNDQFRRKSRGWGWGNWIYPTYIITRSSRTSSK